MVSEYMRHRPRRRRGRRRPRRHRGRRPHTPRPYPLAEFLGGYCLAWAFLLAASAVLGPAGFLIAYPLCGFVYTRYVMRRVIWHEFTNTVANVAAAKWNAFVFWPVVYPVFFVQLAICRFL